MSRRLRDDLDIALLSGRGYTGIMLDTSGDPAWTLTPSSIQDNLVTGEEGPASQVRLTNSPTLYTDLRP